MAKPNFSFSKIIADIKNGSYLKVIAQNSDLFLPVGLMIALGTILFDVPREIISTLVVINLAISFIILGTSLYISTPLQLTSYPTILLVTTLFRLCLSVSIARAVLLHADAGSVIKAIGEVAAGNNIAVGFVMFLLILVVQFIVIAKGAERVAEVGARFTLDALPGKQMSIDADMRSGLISQDQARRMRSELQRESQLYGAMDGAMKFIKGDSIATIVIAIINIVAGLAIGMSKGKPLIEAANQYIILTIGDGLAAIISSFLVTISAGIVVTRVAASDDPTDVGSDIGKQLFTNPKPVIITAVVFALLAPITGLYLPLGLGAVVLGGGAYFLYKKQQKTLEAERERALKVGATVGQDDLQPTFAVPLAVVVSSGITHLIDRKSVV